MLIDINRTNIQLVYNFSLLPQQDSETKRLLTDTAGAVLSARLLLSGEHDLLIVK